MSMIAEWRTKGNLSDAIVLVDDRGSVAKVLPANQIVLSRFLTLPPNTLAEDQGQASDGDEKEPSAWGELVASRAANGEVIEVDPELFWRGIYVWFRSRGVDYDTPGLLAASLQDDPAVREALEAMGIDEWAHGIPD